MNIGPSILDPLTNIHTPTINMQVIIQRAMQESFRYRNLPISILVPYKAMANIALQSDSPLPAWPCGTFAMSIT